jgi:hypothetical protein
LTSWIGTSATRPPPSAGAGWVRPAAAVRCVGLFREFAPEIVPGLGDAFEAPLSIGSFARRVHRSRPGRSPLRLRVSAVNRPARLRWTWGRPLTFRYDPPCVKFVLSSAAKMPTAVTPARPAAPPLDMGLIAPFWDQLPCRRTSGQDQRSGPRAGFCLLVSAFCPLVPAGHGVHPSLSGLDYPNPAPAVVTRPGFPYNLRPLRRPAPLEAGALSLPTRTPP